jgi:four helix bundle protein
LRDYAKIEAWKMADDLTVAVYERTRCFPKEELYGLTSQVRRAVSSVLANIVEGSARESKRDYVHFLYIARGSLVEAQYFLQLARRLGYISAEEDQHLQDQTRQTFACLHGLVQSVEQESSRLSKGVALLTSAIVLSLSLLAQTLT